MAGDVPMVLRLQRKPGVVGPQTINPSLRVDVHVPLRSPEKMGYESVGVIEKQGTTTLEITELPIKKWTEDYKVSVLQAMLSTEGPGSGQIEDFKEPLGGCCKAFTCSLVSTCHSISFVGFSEMILVDVMPHPAT